MNPISKNQGSGILERVLYGVALAAAMKLVQRGWIDADMAAYIAGGVVSLIGGAWGWYTNRPAKLIEAVSAIPNPQGINGKTVVVTDPAIANSTTALAAAPNVLSSTDAKVVQR